ncbi:MAG: signal peptidase II [Proteobacteria bacterium]|nr:signal peptidase II [Pseudomonadota bacterium]
MSLPLQEGIQVFSWFDLYLTYNSGAAFSFLAGASGWQRWFFVTIGFVAVTYMIYLVCTNLNKKVFCLSLTFIIGGALGNLIDRIFLGVVTDFISVHLDEYYWPAFNMADSFITIGAFLILYDILRDSENNVNAGIEKN